MYVEQRSESVNYKILSQNLKLDNHRMTTALHLNAPLFFKKAFQVVGLPSNRARLSLRLLPP